MDVERRVGRSSLSGVVVVPSRENPAYGGGLGDERDDFHLCAAPACQRVDVIDFVDELCPSFAQRAFLGSGFSRSRLSFVLLSVAAMRHGGAHAVGVGPIQMNQVLVGLGDVDEHTGEKFERVERLGVAGILSGFGLINKDARFGMIAKAGKVHRSTVQIASESVEPFGVVGIDRGVIVNAEAKVIPTMPPE